MEVWKDVVGYEGLYRVSNLGNVYSVKRTVKCGRACRDFGGIILKKRLDISGYWTVCLADGKGDKRPKKVHRLVAEAFIPNDNGLPCINHKDENKLNNEVSNLEWCTVAYNNNYGTHQQRSSQSRMNHPKRSKPVRCIETGIIYPSIREAERQTGIDESLIWHQVKGMYPAAKGTHWEYVERR